MRLRLPAVLLALTLSVAAAAEPAQAPQGPVVLTLTGEVGRTNRGPFDPWADKFMAYQETRFDRAMAFDREMLAALGMRRITVKYPDWPAAHEFEGPLLKDVLAAAGVSGGTLHPVALDGYAATIPYGDLEKYEVILALKMDGRWLPLGGAGPAWTVYPRDDHPELAQEDDAKWVWGVTHIRIDGGR